MSGVNLLWTREPSQMYGDYQIDTTDANEDDCGSKGKDSGKIDARWKMKLSFLDNPEPRRILSFLDLPAEVRTMIYHYLFPPESNYVVHSTPSRVIVKVEQPFALRAFGAGFTNLSNYITLPRDFYPPEDPLMWTAPVTVNRQDASRIQLISAIARTCRTVRSEVQSLIQANVDVELRMVEPITTFARCGAFKSITTLRIGLEHLPQSDYFTDLVKTLGTYFPSLSRVIIMQRVVNLNSLAFMAGLDQISHLETSPQGAANLMAQMHQNLLFSHPKKMVEFATSMSRVVTNRGVPQVLLETRFDMFSKRMHLDPPLWWHDLSIQIDMTRKVVHSATPLYVVLGKRHEHDRCEYNVGEEDDLLSHVREIHKIPHNGLSSLLDRPVWRPWDYLERISNGRSYRTISNTWDIMSHNTRGLDPEDEMSICKRIWVGRLLRQN